MSSNKKYQVTKELGSAIKVLGDSWILSILCNLSSSAMRFNELQRAVDINPVTLTDRLKKLESNGIIRREEETRDKLSVVYELTAKGRAILPIIREIKGFAERFYKE